VLYHTLKIRIERAVIFARFLVGGASQGRHPGRWTRRLEAKYWTLDGTTDLEADVIPSILVHMPNLHTFMHEVYHHLPDLATLATTAKFTLACLHLSVHSYSPGGSWILESLRGLPALRTLHLNLGASEDPGGPELPRICLPDLSAFVCTFEWTRITPSIRQLRRFELPGLFSMALHTRGDLSYFQDCTPEALGQLEPLFLSSTGLRKLKLFCTPPDGKTLLDLATSVPITSLDIPFIPEQSRLPPSVQELRLSCVFTFPRDEELVFQYLDSLLNGPRLALRRVGLSIYNETSTSMRLPFRWNLYDELLAAYTVERADEDLCLPSVRALCAYASQMAEHDIILEDEDGAKRRSLNSVGTASPHS
jgi:hypothetical protein